MPTPNPRPEPRMPPNRQLFRLALVYKKCLGTIGVMAFLSGVAVILQMANLSRIIDSAFLGSAGLGQLLVPFLWLGGAVCLRAGTLGISELAAQQIAGGVKQHLRNQLFKKLIACGPLFTQREKTGELAGCSVEGVEKLDAWYRSFLQNGLAMGLVPPLIALFVLWIDWPSGILLILTGPLVPVFMALIGISAKQKIDRQWSALQRMSGHFLDVLQGLATLHLLGRSSLQGANIARISEQFRRTTMQVLLVAFLSGMVLELAASISTAIVAVEIGVRLIEGAIRFQTGLLVLLLAPEFYLPFRLFGASHHAGMEGAAAGETIFGLLDGEGLVGSSARNGWVARMDRVDMVDSVDTVDGSAGVQVRFQNVGYQYPGAMISAVSGLTFDLEPGRIHLLCGHSGSGKSTVMKLLLRFVEPAQGALLANGQPLPEISPAVWRRQVAWVPQHPHFFEGSVLDNLRIACPDASLEEVRAAAAAAEADEFILRLPQGYQTQIGEAANRFSGGERQRLAIARAFLQNGSLLLVDEPVSHMDRETALKLQRAFLRLAEGRTTLVISHHGFASTEADVVLTLSRGRLAYEAQATL